MKILAVADVHCPKYLEEFRRSLSTSEKPDLFLLAGDMIHFSKVTEFRNVIDAIEEHLGVGFPIIGCFGNEEHKEIRNELVFSMKEKVIFLNEESIVLNYCGQRIGIIGTPAPIDQHEKQGFSDEGIKNIFEKRVRRISQLLKTAESDADLTILLTHYSPILESGDRDNMDSFSWWISQAIKNVQPDLVVHGHVHISDKLEVTIGKTKVINVAFPATKKVTEILL